MEFNHFHATLPVMSLEDSSVTPTQIFDKKCMTQCLKWSETKYLHANFKIMVKAFSHYTRLQWPKF